MAQATRNEFQHLSDQIGQQQEELEEVYARLAGVQAQNEDCAIRIAQQESQIRVLSQQKKAREAERNSAVEEKNKLAEKLAQVRANRTSHSRSHSRSRPGHCRAQRHSLSCRQTMTDFILSQARPVGCVQGKKMRLFLYPHHWKCYHHLHRCRR